MHISLRLGFPSQPHLSGSSRGKHVGPAHSLNQLYPEQPCAFPAGFHSQHQGIRAFSLLFRIFPSVVFQLESSPLSDECGGSEAGQGSIWLSSTKQLRGQESRWLEVWLHDRLRSACNSSVVPLIVSPTNEQGGFGTPAGISGNVPKHLVWIGRGGRLPGRGGKPAQPVPSPCGKTWTLTLRSSQGRRWAGAPACPSVTEHCVSGMAPGEEGVGRSGVSSAWSSPCDKPVRALRLARSMMLRPKRSVCPSQLGADLTLHFSWRSLQAWIKSSALAGVGTPGSPNYWWVLGPHPPSSVPLAWQEATQPEGGGLEPRLPVHGRLASPPHTCPPCDGMTVGVTARGAAPSLLSLGRQRHDQGHLGYIRRGFYAEMSPKSFRFRERWQRSILGVCFCLWRTAI